MGYAMALSRDRETARDLLQDCVARALIAPSLPESEPAFRAFLFTTLRNLWIDRVRRERRKVAVDEAMDLLAEVAMQPVGLESVLVNALAVRQAFARLSEDHRDVLSLVDIAGFGYGEAALVLGIPPGTVMSRVSRARRALSSMLTDSAVEMLPRRGTAQR